MPVRAAVSVGRAVVFISEIHALDRSVGMSPGGPAGRRG